MPLLFVRYCFIIMLICSKEGLRVGELIAIVSGKGGTGKTSMCAAIAQALAESDEKVLCIDCDVGMRNLDIALGLTQMGALSFQEARARGDGSESHRPSWPHSLSSGVQPRGRPRTPSTACLLRPLGGQ